MFSKDLETIQINGESLERFLLFLKKEFSLDYTGYSQTFLVRRIAGFLQEHNLNTIELLHHLLIQEPALVSSLRKELNIHYTEMFRDPDFFDSLRKNAFPFLSTYPSLHIWHAGCSTGEEVYSLAILLSEVGLLERSRIIATDSDPLVLEKAREAIFDVSRIKEFTGSYYKAGGQSEFSNYYSSAYGQLKFNEQLRKNISFRKHNLVSDPVIRKFNLVLCRNVMIYFSPELQNKVVGLLGRSLSNLGYLGLGATETLSFNKYRNEFSAIDKSGRIYRKVSLSEWKNCKN